MHRPRKEVRRTGERGHDLAVGDRVTTVESESRTGVIVETGASQCRVELDTGELVYLDKAILSYEPTPADIQRRAAECSRNWTDAQERQRNVYRAPPIEPHRWDAG